MIKKFQKKPVVIEALQFNGFNPSEVKDFVGIDCEVNYSSTAYDAGVCGMIAEIVIHTLEGDMKASKGDWIIKGVKGEFYPCKPDIFEQTYGEVV